MKKRNFLTLAGLAFLLISSNSIAQSNGAISGTVSDSTGQLLPGVLITLELEGEPEKHSAVTNQHGQWRITDLRASGPYTASASLAGFKTQTFDGIRVKPDQEKRIDFVLQLSSVDVH